MQKLAKWIEAGNAVLGIEFGSTRIKAVLIGEDHAPIASGDFTWDNRLENGVWTYHLDEVWTGVQAAYANLSADVLEKYGVKLTKLAGLGISGMMHGYLPFDADGNQLAEFRTWRNTITAQAAEELTALLGFSIPQRWSIAHLYQAILNGEAHVKDIARLTTLAGYVHYKLTGKHVMGVGEASGMFPIDSAVNDYDQAKVDAFDANIADRGFGWKLRDILPEVLPAGGDAGELTEAGAKLLDPTGTLQPGAVMAPPEGDAGTGMAATNAVAVRTGNVSAGTSVFAMVVLEKPLSKVYPEIDMVTTPSGKPVAMVHCNNCTSDINAWAGMLKGFAEAAGLKVSMGDIYTAIFTSAMQGEKDCGGVVNVPYLSGEHTTGLSEGRPMTLRTPEAQLTFANFSRSLVLGAVTSLKMGMGILRAEQVKIDSLLGHGGYFKTPGTAQKLLAAALNAPVSVMETAGEGGPWGMALLAAYRVYGAAGQTLESYLAEKVFAGANCVTMQPDEADVQGADMYAARFEQALEAEKAAVKAIR
ncbi:MAG: ATPase [Clostridia bacterium]|nr:ATPase [Clostridia bacterium]